MLQADDLLFCYRWLLLEMKREFAFEDALRMLEVMWSSLPPTDPLDDLPLYEVRFCSASQFPPPPSPSPRETPYTKVCALRRKNASGKVLMINRSLDESIIARRRLHSSFCNKPKKFCSLDENTLFKDRYNSLKNVSTSLNETSNSTTVIYNSSSSDSDSSKSFSCNEKNSTELNRRIQSPTENKKGNLASHFCTTKQTTSKIVKNFSEFLTLDKKLVLKEKHNEEMTEYVIKANEQSDSCKNNNSSPDDSNEYCPLTTSMTQKLSEDLENLEKRVFDINLESDYSKNNEVFIWENPLQEEIQDEVVENTMVALSNNRCEFDERNTVSLNGNVSNRENFEYNTVKCKETLILPRPKEFGGGNPFLMFLCITVLCQHRDVIMKSGMDYNEIAMHFDKMVRKHNVIRVLNQARIMYATYLKQYKENFLNV